MIDQKTLKRYYEKQGEMDFNRQLYENPNPYRREFHKSRKSWVIWFLCRYACLYKTKSLLDAGCGDGEYIWLFDGEQMDLHGIDISSSFINKARTKAPDAKFKVGSLEHLPYKDNQFDVVLCSETLEHVIDYPKALSEICRVSKKYVVISVPIEKSHPFIRLGLRILGKKDMIPS
jgi:ubiquinone/menaquinone biosynthesis C-methylase UbiE